MVEVYDDFDGRYYDYYDEDDEPEEIEGECYMAPNGQCGAAGSEYCDWDCPYYGINGGR